MLFNSPGIQYPNIHSSKESFTSSSLADKVDLERSQTVIRLVLGALAITYLVLTVFLGGHFSKHDYYTLATGGSYLVLALMLHLWVRKNKNILPIRRILGILLDNCAITLALYFRDELGAPLFILYLWVAFGNGFRYGQSYLAFSATCSVFGFIFVSASSQYFQDNLYLSYALLLGLIILPMYIASLLRKLTKTLEIAENANRAKSNFLATMSHEIRTPLNGLVGITDLLDKTELNHKQQHYVNLISKSSDWLMRVISDGLDFSKIEANELLLVEETFNLQHSLQELCTLYKGLHRKKAVTFSCNISEKLPEYVKGDQLRLTQVLSNLITNSFKFTDQGTITFEALPQEKRRNGVLIQFRVEDTGPGIPQEEHENIFKPFKQVTTSDNSTVGGTGLGLAIANRLIDLMGGTLELDSRPGKGSTFFFTLFFKTEKELQDIPAKELTPAAGIVWKNQPSILLIEDHEINREVIASQLREMGCHVHFASNGREAVNHFKARSFDLLLMDCQMPILDGYDATRRIRNHEMKNPSKKHTPIIALTAHVTIDDRNKCLESGMDDYLGKPFRVHELQNKLCHWLASHLDGEGTVAAQPPPLKAAQSPTDLMVKVNLPDGERKLFHDLRNALFVIQANAEFSISPDIEANQKESFAEIIHEAAGRAVKDLEKLSQTRKKAVSSGE